MDTDQFIQQVTEFYTSNGRHNLPWRKNLDPYGIFVSEIMLQQTQVERVVGKFEVFMGALPSWTALHGASTSQVLSLWQGLGYNRRAIWLQEAAHKVVTEFAGNLPQNYNELQTLKGIGANTAGSVMAFAFNKPVVFIETNIRRVYIHHFFNDQERVADQDILQIVDATLDQANPRQWYWALMDYGSYLAKTVPNPNRQSKHYAKQSKFEGSLRQIRGQVVRELTKGPQTTKQLQNKIPDKRLQQVLHDLKQERLITQDGQHYMIRESAI